MLVVECGPGHDAERAYVVSVLLGEFLGLEHRLVTGPPGDTVIRCPADGGNERRLVIRDVLFQHARRLLDPAALPVSPLRRIRADELGGATVLDDLPVLYGNNGGTRRGLTSPSDGVVEIDVDVFGGAFAMLTRLEEAVLPAQDAHGRFPLSATLASREGFVDRPLVNEYAEVLWCALARLWPRLVRRRREHRLVPTHDVDWPFFSRGRLGETLAAATHDLVVRRNRSLARARLRSLLAVRGSGRDADECNTFAFLMRTSEEHGVRSAFYFMAGAGHPRYDSGYSLEDPWLVRLVRELVQRGHEVGIHPGYGTHLDAAALQAEVGHLRHAWDAASLPPTPLGGRQHFLRWANPFTWRNWEAAGLAYDSTLGFSESGGFRAGTCFDYPAFDLEERRTLSLRERPLVAMEASYLSHQGLSPDEAADRMRELRDRCRRFGGDFVFLWHNNRLAQAGERRAYASLFAD
jgi:hypothetical protein